MQVVFPCNHATCKDCYQRLVVKLLEDDTVCPMCRAPLAEPILGVHSLYLSVGLLDGAVSCLN